MRGGIGDDLEKDFSGFSWWAHVQVGGPFNQPRNACLTSPDIRAYQAGTQIFFHKGEGATVRVRVDWCGPSFLWENFGACHTKKDVRARITRHGRCRESLVHCAPVCPLFDHQSTRNFLGLIGSGLLFSDRLELVT